MSFDFFKTIVDYGDVIADFLKGDEVMTSDMARRGEKPRRDGGGFLDFVKGGAEAYAAMTESDEDKEAFESVKYEEPSLRRYSGKADIGRGVQQTPQPFGAADARVQQMYRNLRNRTYANADMNRIGRDLRVQLTKKQGQRTVGLEPARTPQVKEAAPAAIRKHEKDVV